MAQNCGGSTRAPYTPACHNFTQASILLTQAIHGRRTLPSTAATVVVAENFTPCERTDSMTAAFSSRRWVATAMLAALTLPALAQTQAPAPAAAQAASAPARKAGDMAQRYQERMAQRQAALKEKLKLTAAQESAWTQFTAAMQPGERPARPDFKELDKLTTPERIDRMRELRARHTAQADKRDEAVKTFYAALSPEQQKTFDAEFHRQGPGKHRGGRDHGGMHGHHHGPDGHGGRGPGGPAR